MQEKLLRLVETAETIVELFPKNQVCRRIDSQEFQMQDYHKILLMLFHQVSETSSSYSLAAANLDLFRHDAAKDYLMLHAEEEKSHWHWCLNDLNETGYTGKDPSQLLPSPECSSYIAFSFYVAFRVPLARLAIAYVIESIGAKYGKLYATKITQILRLNLEKVTFFNGHGDTDKVHSQEIINLLSNIQLITEREWNWIFYAAKTAGILYTAMYNAALKP